MFMLYRVVRHWRGEIYIAEIEASETKLMYRFSRYCDATDSLSQISKDDAHKRGFRKTRAEAASAYVEEKKQELDQRMVALAEAEGNLIEAKALLFNSIT